MIIELQLTVRWVFIYTIKVTGIPLNARTPDAYNAAKVNCAKPVYKL